MTLDPTFSFRKPDVEEPLPTVPGYTLEELSSNEWFTLYRGRRKEDSESIFLKVHRKRHFSVANGEAPRREFELLSKLSVPGIPQASELIQWNGSCYLLLKGQNGRPLREHLSFGQLRIESFFKLAIPLCKIVAELHRRELICRGLNPHSILVDPVTGEVCITDLSLASRDAAESQLSLPLQSLRSLLPYVSPEQTGRMNRATDYRTDFYSLGAIFYEMLTGLPPFHSEDPLEVIHGHIARIPRTPADLDHRIPEPLSRMVMKLLAKTAEERYQSALGIEQDLEWCQREWAAHASIAPFSLGQRDVSDRFSIPQRLYGREPEVNTLLETFERTRQGPAALMLVAGYSGIGKTSLIQELYRPIACQRGYFISGKFDQVVRNIPFGALIQAFRGLVQQLLTESKERLDVWRVRLSEVLGTAGVVLAEVIPELELILGKQPPPSTLGPTEALNRFQLTFHNFVGAVACQEHPLVVFLDDLQWADAATLSLFRPLLTSPDIRSLFLIGTYRDNEVDDGHPLARTLKGLESAGAQLHQVLPGPLQLSDLTLFIRDTLHGELSDAEPLARLVMEKTGGNPFFVIQFLKALKQEGFLKFDYEEGHWAYRIEAIRGAAMTDNVIDLMSRKIQGLAPRSKRALTLAACIGNIFDQKTLAIVSQHSPEAAGDDLKEALEEGLILPAPSPYDVFTEGPEAAAAVTPSYAFLHDRVQQAAYALIPDERKQLVHLAVGRLLLDRSAPGTADEKIFDIVHHLNRGTSLIADDKERLGLAQLDLRAGQKAKSSTAYEAALSYLKAGLSLLADGHWDSNYELMFTLHIEAAECEYLCGHFDEAERCFGLLLKRAQTRLDKARVYNLGIVQYENMSRYADAVRTGMEGLALFQIVFPGSAEEKEMALEHELKDIESLLGGRTINSLIELPVMEDPEIRAAMKLLTSLWAPAYIVGDQVLTRLISATMVRFSLRYGNTEESAYGYVTHAITVGNVRGDYRSAYEWGKLALEVNERFNDPKQRAKVHQQFNAHVNLWRRPMQTCIPHAREACRSGLETGDFTYAGYGVFTESWAALLTSRDLDRFVRDYSPSIVLLERIKMAGLVDAQKILLNWARSLQGLTLDKLSLSDGSFDEGDYLKRYGSIPFFMTFFYVAKFHLCVLFEEYGKASETVRNARRVVHALGGTVWLVLLDFLSGLNLASLCRDASEQERHSYLEELAAVRESLKIRADNCPENFLCASLLVAAETEHLGGRDLEAMPLYEEAIRSAGETRNLMGGALASELYARFWRDRGNEAVAGLYLREAHGQYAGWGAKAKVKDLEEKYPLLLSHAQSQVRAEAGGPRPALTATASDSEALDLTTVMKASQAISGEIVLSRLLEKLMRIAIENAGARRGVLILEKEGELVIEAEGSIDRDDVTVLLSTPVSSRPELASAVVNYVKRTRESLVLADAGTDPKFAHDPYVIQSQAKSILCLPILKLGNLVGLLYLENNLTTNAFTPDRIEVMQILSSQAAVSLENARLYDEMKAERTQALRESEARFRRLFEHAGDAFFVVNSVGNFLDVNQAACESLGYTKDELLTRRFVDLDEEWTADRIETLLERLMSGGPVTIEATHRRKDGTIFPIEIHAALLESGENPCLLAVARDITERKCAEVRLREAKEAAEAANRAKSEFLARMSHELRTPLNSILGYAQIFRRDKTLTLSKREGALIVQKSGEHLLGLINEVLDLAKIEAGQMTLRSANFDLPGLLKDIAEISRIRAEQRGLSFNYQPLSPLPEVMRGDEQRLRQVLINLLGNATKFTQQGGVTLKVGCHEEVPGKPRILFQVEDSGVGIAPKQLEAIFLPFQQAGDQQRWMEGTGLGLTISRELTRMMGGELRVKSTPGEGSVFWFELDLIEVTDRVEAGAAQGQLLLGFKGRPRKVLIVDDKWENRSVLVQLLSPLGFELAEAADGRECLAKGVEFRPDLILMDLVMPGIDGFEATRQIRRLPTLEEVVVIAISASAFDLNRQQSLEAGCNDFIPKPVEAESLMEKLRTHLNLEWIYGPNEAGTALGPVSDPPVASQQLTTAARRVGPPADVAATLFELAMRGDIKAILAQVEGIGRLGDQFVPFANELRGLAKDHRMKEIRERVREFMQ